MRFTALAFVGVAAAAAVTVAPPVQKLRATVRADALAKKIRYGPFNLAAASAADGITSDMQQLFAIEAPCKDCTLLKLRADVEFADGTNAPSPGNGVYPHHMALALTGKSVLDATCGMTNTSLVYNVGNERAPIVFTTKALKDNSGVYVGPEDFLSLNALLWNAEPVAKTVYVTMDYEYLPGKPAGLANLRSVWLNVAQGTCTPDDTESVRAVGDFQPPKKDFFTIGSTEWVSRFDGTLISAVGHMHDGGVAVRFFHNGEFVCESVSAYDPKLTAAIKNLKGMSNIATMSVCDIDNRAVKKGDKFHIQVDYDFTKHMGMMEDDGSLSSVMGTGTLFIAEA